MSFRQSVNKWGAVVIVGMIAFGIFKAAMQHFDKSVPSSLSVTAAPPAPPTESITSLQLSPEEQAEAARIKGGGNLAGQMGHNISHNTKLFLIGDNFGENVRCAIHVNGQDPRGQLVNGRWNVVIQTGPGGILWTVNMLGSDGGEVRLVLSPSGKRYALDKKISGDGRGISLGPELLEALMGSGSAKASSGLLGNTELGNEYDLSSFRRAYRLASAVCQ